MPVIAPSGTPTTAASSGRAPRPPGSVARPAALSSGVTAEIPAADGPARSSATSRSPATGGL